MLVPGSRCPSFIPWKAAWSSRVAALTLSPIVVAPITQDDTIWIATDIGAVGFLAKFPGLELVQQEQVDKTGTSILYRHLVQAAVSHKGPIVGKTVRDVRFRTLYNAAVVAVHREGARVPLKVRGCL